MGAVFTDGSLARSLGRSFIWPVVQLHMSRTQQKGREGSAEPGGSWQDQDCLSVSPAAGWDDVSADPHPGRPGSCFSLKVVSKGAAALTSAMHRHSRSCLFPPSCSSASGCQCEGMCVLHDSGELCVAILLWQKSHRGYMSREHWRLQEKEGCGLFFAFLYNLKTPEDACYFCVSSHWENWSLK